MGRALPEQLQRLRVRSLVSIHARPLGRALPQNCVDYIPN
ncbi:protein of unknown function [Trichlorobacter ammonificans]|uniref:Uncharacterized protein n=1 Tax=Trichlorobacter ammonificans TaxID=2916410 RepID=A0ABN8HDJ0_9BACT|nr:protein of unknown function [Trichlorobacter ammonificans]